MVQTKSGLGLPLERLTFRAGHAAFARMSNQQFDFEQALIVNAPNLTALSCDEARALAEKHGLPTTGEGRWRVMPRRALMEYANQDGYQRPLDGLLTAEAARYLGFEYTASFTIWAARAEREGVLAPWTPPKGCNQSRLYVPANLDAAIKVVGSTAERHASPPAKPKQSAKAKATVHVKQPKRAAQPTRRALPPMPVPPASTTPPPTPIVLEPPRPLRVLDRTGPRYGLMVRTLKTFMTKTPLADLPDDERDFVVDAVVAYGTAET